jgi:bifunctional UDP-N-acetylglucosamine pyrophosphorylase/glucosamine-1-phosphate N-acetyltransferase
MGRVLTDADGNVERVVEWADANAEEREVALCNAGVICAPASQLFGWLRAIRNDNAKGEYYLTDAVGLAREAGAGRACRPGARGRAAGHQQPP